MCVYLRRFQAPFPYARAGRHGRLLCLRRQLEWTGQIEKKKKRPATPGCCPIVPPIKVNEKKEKSFPLSTILKQLKVKCQYKKRRKIKQGGRRTSQKNLVERRTCWNSADTVTLSCNHLRKDGDEWLSAPARPESLLLWKTGPRQIAQNERAWMMGLGRAFRVTHQPSHRAGPERQIERKTRATTDGGDELQGCVNRKRMKTTTRQKEKEKSRLRRDG